ncbi:hypothetical protein Gotur_017095, partial [Gossypium turneri]
MFFWTVCKSQPCMKRTLLLHETIKGLLYEDETGSGSGAEMNIKYFILKTEFAEMEALVGESTLELVKAYLNSLVMDGDLVDAGVPDGRWLA